MQEIIAKLEELSVEELKGVIAAAQKILMQKTMEGDGMVRIFIPPAALGDARKCTVRPHARLVTAVNLEKTNFFAFEGNFIPVGKEIDIPTGSIVIIVCGDGSWKHPHSTAFVCVAERVTPEDAQRQAKDYRFYRLTNLRILKAFDAASAFLSLRDYVASLL